MLKWGTVVLMSIMRLAVRFVREQLMRDVDT